MASQTSKGGRRQPLFTLLIAFRDFLYLIIAVVVRKVEGVGWWWLLGRWRVWGGGGC